MENWKTIEGFEDYEVSNLGRVKRTVALERTRAGKVMTPWDNGLGYLRVALRKDGKRYSRYLHILVAKAFIPNPLGLPEVNHKGLKSDCRVNRLEWRSHKGNMLDAAQRELTGNAGVSLNPKLGSHKKWRARYNALGQSGKFIGYFVTKKEARTARRAMVAKLPRIE